MAGRQYQTQIGTDVLTFCFRPFSLLRPFELDVHATKRFAIPTLCWSSRPGALDALLAHERKDLPTRINEPPGRRHSSGNPRLKEGALMIVAGTPSVLAGGAAAYLPVANLRDFLWS